MLSSQSAASAMVRFPQLKFPKLELQFKDGSSTWLHQVNHAHGLDLFVREIEDGPARRLIDLRRIAPSLEKDMNDATHGDRAGVIFFTLRRHFTSVADFMRAARELAQ